MDCKKIGNLIVTIRREKNMTQKEFADKLHVSDKTISKWERGLGCPDITLINDLSEILEMNIKEMLSGEINTNEMDGGNMKKIKFYVCPNCNNIITSTNDVTISCCGKNLKELEVKEEIGKDHELIIETVDDEYYVHMNHEMNKEHYISFVAYTTSDKLYLNKLYPEQGIELRFRKSGHGFMYLYCTKHGLARIRI